MLSQFLKANMQYFGISKKKVHKKQEDTRQEGMNMNMKPISLEIALKTKLVGIGDYFYYQPIESKVELTKEQTGYEGEQILHTELGLKWRLDRLKNRRFILVANDATEQEIIFSGKIGHDEGPNTMNYTSESLYFNRELAIGVVAMDERIFYQLDKCNQTSPTRQYWLGSPYVCTYTGFAYFGLRLVGSGFVNIYDLYYSDGTTNTDYFGVRPVVYLKSDLVVVAGSGTEEDPWKLDEISLGDWDSNGEFHVTLEKLLKNGINIKDAIFLRTVRVGDYILYPHKAGSKIMKLAYHQRKIILLEEKRKKNNNNSGIITVNPNWILAGGMGTKNNPWVIKP